MLYTFYIDVSTLTINIFNWSNYPELYFDLFSHFRKYFFTGWSYFVRILTLWVFWVGFDTSNLSPEDMVKLNSGLEYIMDVVGESIPETTMKVSKPFILPLRHIWWMSRSKKMQELICWILVLYRRYLIVFLYKDK